MFISVSLPEIDSFFPSSSVQPEAMRADARSNISNTCFFNKLSPEFLFYIKFMLTPEIYFWQVLFQLNIGAAHKNYSIIYLKSGYLQKNKISGA